LRSEEVRAAARLGGQAFAGVVSRVEGVHRAVAGRAFGATGLAGLPARAVHDVVSGTVYAGLRGAGLGTGWGAGEVLALLAPASSRAGRTPFANRALAALNGFAGDQLASEANHLAIHMALRVAGHDVPATPAVLATVVPDATTKMAVLVHGLAETEQSWVVNSPDGADSGYGPRLRAELGYTPVYVRYNSGRHISDNGRLLSRLLDELIAGWAVPVDEVLLVGHSMGGLVIRSACHYGSLDGRRWVPLVRHIVYLGSPHLGAPLARAAGLAGWALTRLPETRPFAPLVNGSSAGVKDLRYGYVRDEDWWGCDPDRCVLDHRGDVPLLASANHHTISATVTADPDSPVGAVVGDLLVQPASVHGRHRDGRDIPFAAEHRRRLGGFTHFHLLHHPSVWAAITSVLQPPTG
jgi:PGAP1-like protein